MKFAKQGRFSFSVCVVIDKDGNKIGVRMKPFDYSGKKIITISAFKKMVQQEISRVRNLTMKEKLQQRWAGNTHRPDNMLWENDRISFMKGIGPKKCTILESAGVKTVKDFKVLDDSSIKNLSAQSKIGIKVLHKIKKQSIKALSGTTPYPLRYDWTKDTINPYLKRYGEDKWEEKIQSVSRSGLTRVVNVTKLIEHIEKETKKAYADTPFKDTYKWSHDALTQMCDKECKAWMIANKCWDRWIKPELGCNNVVWATNEETKETLVSRRYGERPVGDQPELMPHDASLNWDVDCSLNMHVLLTAHLSNDDPEKFRKDTPKNISEAIMKLYDPDTGVVPSSKRIIQDCERVIQSAQTIVSAGGKIVPELVNRNGHRKKLGIGRRFWPRKTNQVIATMDELGIFKNTQTIALEYFNAEAEKYNKSKLS